MSRHLVILKLSTYFLRRSVTDLSDTSLSVDNADRRSAPTGEAASGVERVIGQYNSVL